MTEVRGQRLRLRISDLKDKLKKQRSSSRIDSLFLKLNQLNQLNQLFILSTLAKYFKES